ncbi:hypothetical protein [Candidatus Darwinibacter acetoxidans]
MNAHIESFHSILESDCLSRHEFQTYAEAYKRVSEFMDYYPKMGGQTAITDSPDSSLVARPV